MLTRKTLSKFATLESLVQSFLPKRGMTAFSFTLFQQSLIFTGNISVAKASAYYRICINTTERGNAFDEQKKMKEYNYNVD